MSQFQCNTLRVACCLLVCCCCCCLWYFFLFPVLLFHEYSNSLVASFNSLGMRAANKKSLQKIIILFCNFVRYFCYSLCGIFTFCCCTVLLCSACITTGMICSVACGRRMWTVEWSCPLVELNCDGHDVGFQLDSNKKRWFCRRLQCARWHNRVVGVQTEPR